VRSIPALAALEDGNARNQHPSRATDAENKSTVVLRAHGSRKEFFHGRDLDVQRSGDRAVRPALGNSRNTAHIFRGLEVKLAVANLTAMRV